MGSCPTTCGEEVEILVGGMFIYHMLAYWNQPKIIIIT
jgi:hypothetical protein